MADSSVRLRVATYNIHKCRGLDRRVRPDRIASVLWEIDADLIALQEVVNVPDGPPEAHQGDYLAAQLKRNVAHGEVRQIFGGRYGNVTLSRWPIREICNYDISVRGQEPRGCLRTDIELPTGQCIHFFNVHLGTSFMERRHQARKLVNEALLEHPDLEHPRILVGDFNEWTRGLTSQLLSAHLVSADIRTHLQRARTYPGVLPFLHLDHVYHEENLQVEQMKLLRNPLSLVASDHLPLVADLVWSG